jgi:hypothetical protein
LPGGDHIEGVAAVSPFVTIAIVGISPKRNRTIEWPCGAARAYLSEFTKFANELAGPRLDQKTV